MSVRRAVRRLLKNDEGLGMPEILVAMMVFAVIATTAAYGIVNSLTLTQRSRASETAMSLASSDLDQMRLLASANDDGVFSILSTSSSKTQSVGGTIYTIDRAVSWQTTTGSIGACGTGSGTLQYKNVTDTVSWRGANGLTQTVKMSSAVAPKSNINSDATGTIIVTVTGASGAPMPGLKVTMTPIAGGGGDELPSPPQNTDNAGCSFGLLVDPGSYAVTASTANGIDLGQSTTAGATAVVVAGQNTLVNLTYDLAATFPLIYPAGATLPTNLPVTLYNAAAVPAGPSSQPPGPVYAATQSTGTPSVKAFPFTNGYTILAGTYLYSAATSSGSCLDTDPGAWITARTPDGAIGTSPVPIAAAPGTTAPPTALAMGTVTINGLGPLKGKYVTAVTTTAGPGDPGCAAGQTLTFPVISSVSMNLALPFGTWRLYSGSSAGQTTTSLPSSGNGTLTAGPGAFLNNVSGGITTVTLDPRTVPSP